jgi:hypothetical protein
VLVALLPMALARKPLTTGGHRSTGA